MQQAPIRKSKKGSREAQFFLSNQTIDTTYLPRINKMGLPLDHREKLTFPQAPLAAMPPKT